MSASKKKRTETVDTTKYRYTVIYVPAEEGGFLAYVPTLNNLVTEGETLEDARCQAREAAAGYIEAFQDHGDEVPIESPDAITEVVAVAR